MGVVQKDDKSNVTEEKMIILKNTTPRVIGMELNLDLNELSATLDEYSNKNAFLHKIKRIQLPIKNRNPWFPAVKIKKKLNTLTLNPFTQPISTMVNHCLSKLL
jgi:hypothetical protein